MAPASTRPYLNEVYLSISHGETGIPTFEINDTLFKEPTLQASVIQLNSWIHLAVTVLTSLSITTCLFFGNLSNEASEPVKVEKKIPISSFIGFSSGSGVSEANFNLDGQTISNKTLSNLEVISPYGFQDQALASPSSSTSTIPSTAILTS